MYRNIALVAIMGLGMALFYGCDSGGSGSTTSQMRVLAKNVLFSSSIANAASKTEGVDETTQVLAENVVVDPSGNALSSDNLQSALDNELAIDLSTLLPGTTWTMTNKTTDSWFKDSTGEVAFSTNGTLTVEQGKFGAAGVMSDSELSNINNETGANCVPDSSFSYEIINNSTIYVTWHDDCGSGGSYDRI